MSKPPCIHCDATGWVCENHLSKPWAGSRNDATPATAAQARRVGCAILPTRIIHPACPGPALRQTLIKTDRGTSRHERTATGTRLRHAISRDTIDRVHG